MVATPADLACAAEIVRLCEEDISGGSKDGRKRLKVARLKHACERLKREGVAYPLLEMRFERSGNLLIATSNNIQFDASTGQLLLASAEALIKMHQSRRRLDPRLARVIRAERAAVQQARQYSVRMDQRPIRGSAETLESLLKNPRPDETPTCRTAHRPIDPPS
jgi:hypothetical protein